MSILDTVLSAFGAKRGEIQNDITTSAELYDWLLTGYGAETLSGVVMTPQKAMTVSAVQAAVRVLSESVAQLPIQIYKETEDGRELAPEHPLHNVLAHSPNFWMDSFQFRETMMIHLLLWGNFYGFIVKEPRTGRILEILPIHPSRMQVKQESNWTLTYTMELPENKLKTVPASDLLHIRDGSMNSFTGNSRVMWIKEAIGLSIKAESQGSLTFGNGGRPSGVLSTPEKLKPDDLAKIRESWKAAHGGDKAMGTAVVDANFKFTPVSYNSRDSQYIESRKFQISEVARVFRVPPHMIGDLERATNNNIEHQSLEFVKFALMPWLRRIELAIETQLISRRKNRHIVRFNTRELLRGDMAGLAQYYSNMVQNKLMTRNEVRQFEGLNKVEGGDEFENPAITPTTGEENAAQDDRSSEE